jgi:lipoprotein NlpI
MRKNEMNRIIGKYSLVVVITILIGCSTTGSNRGDTISQLPMYGGFDRQSDPRFKKADEKLISGVTKEFGSQEKASQAFIDQGIRYYQVNDFSMAMKRFNQAWLIDPSNPDSFWGFAIVYHDEGKNCESKSMFDKSLELGLKKPIALADAGRVFTLCAISNEMLGVCRV